MIRIDALYLLLLIELSALLAGGIIFFLIRSRKYRALYQQSMKDLGEARQAQEDLRKRLSVMSRGADAPDGVTVDELNARTREQFNIPSGVRGAVVTDVGANCAAAAARIARFRLAAASSTAEPPITALRDAYEVGLAEALAVQA